MAGRPSPNWQECHTTNYTTKIVLAEPGGLKNAIPYLSHPLQEPEKSIDWMSGVDQPGRFIGGMSLSSSFSGVSFPWKSRKSTI